MAAAHVCSNDMEQHGPIKDVSAVLLVVWKVQLICAARMQRNCGASQLASDPLGFPLQHLGQAHSHASVPCQQRRRKLVVSHQPLWHLNLYAAIDNLFCCAAFCCAMSSRMPGMQVLLDCLQSDPAWLLGKPCLMPPTNAYLSCLMPSRLKLDGRGDKQCIGFLNGSRMRMSS